MVPVPVLNLPYTAPIFSINQRIHVDERIHVCMYISMYVRTYVLDFEFFEVLVRCRTRYLVPVPNNIYLNKSVLVFHVFLKIGTGTVPKYLSLFKTNS